jgi:hypothetical protein
MWLLGTESDKEAVEMKTLGLDTGLTVSYSINLL